MATCPFCSDILLRHIRSNRSYWLCRSCRTEILEDNLTQESPLDKHQKPRNETISGSGKDSHLKMRLTDFSAKISQ